MTDRYLLVFWLTGRCNLHCSYCYACAGEQGRDMDFETARRVIDRFAAYPLKIQFAGGEPTLNFSLAEQICAYVREKHIDAVFQMQTNGTLLTEDMVRKLRENRISAGVSLDGVPEVNALTRGKTAQAVRGIRLLGQAGMVIGINAVVTARNVRQLPGLVDFAVYLGNVGGIGLDLLRLAGRGNGEEEASPQVLRHALRDMYRRSRELEALTGRRIQLREVELAKKRLAGKGSRQHYCYASCGRSVVVTPEGETYPCGSLAVPGFSMGPADRLTPEAIRSLPPVSGPDCGDCPYEAVCPRGCPSRRIRNRDSLECVLLKTAFELAEREAI